MLGIPLARKKPRENRYSMIAVAILAYFGYYLLFTSARTWVQHGAIARFPGIWWVPAILTLVVLTAFYDSDFGFWIAAGTGVKTRPSFLQKRSKKRLYSAIAETQGLKSFSVLFFKKGLLAFARYIQMSHPSRVRTRRDHPGRPVQPAGIRRAARLGRRRPLPRSSDAFLYVALTAPSRLLQVTPISMLLGALTGTGRAWQETPN